MHAPPPERRQLGPFFGFANFSEDLGAEAPRSPRPPLGGGEAAAPSAGIFSARGAEGLQGATAPSRQGSFQGTMMWSITGPKQRSPAGVYPVAIRTYVRMWSVSLGESKDLDKDLSNGHIDKIMSGPDGRFWTRE